MDRYTEQLITQYSSYITENKKELIEKVLARRTRFISIVLEDIFQSQNASATIRTCECFGIQDIYVIEEDNKYKINPKVVHGASKWVNIYQYNNPTHNNLSLSIQDLKQAGYKVIGTSPHPAATSIYDLKIQDKIALLFGNEISGLSSKAMGLCEDMIYIPMNGFTESFNLSVSVAISLSILTRQLHDSDLNWLLTDEEKQNLRLEWYRKIVPKSEIMERAFIKIIKESD